MKTIYVAETDEDGRIQWVWVRRARQSLSHAFDPLSHRFDPGEPAEYVGAPAPLIASWLAARQGAQAPAA